jgi:uncharacterized membrane protein YccC
LSILKEKIILTTTKKLLRKYQACKTRYKYLCEKLGGTKDNDVIPLTKILELNGVNDALWALRAVPLKQQKERNKQARLFACAVVCGTPISNNQTIWDLLTDERSRNAIEASARFAHGKATQKELTAAVHAADAAAHAADAAARDYQSKLFMEFFGV